jgi:hypothetical protein
VLIETGKSYKIGISVITHQADEYPVTTDNSFAINADGNLYSEDNGATWQRISDAGDFYDNLAIIGDITETDHPTENPRDNDLIGYVMFKDGQPQGNVIYQSKFTDNNVTGVENYKYVLSAYYNNGMESKNSDGSTINIKEVLKNNNIVTVYPNPTTGELKIIPLQELKGWTAKPDGVVELRINSIEIFDVYGRKVGAKFPSNSLEGWQPQADGVVINISHLPAGVYFLKIQTEQGVVSSKVIKQ